MGKSRSRLAADWFAKLRVNAITQEVEHEDVVAEQEAIAAAEAKIASDIVTAKALADSEMATAIAGATMASSDILTSLKTVDGSGSGLDADLLDGQSSAYYGTAAAVALNTAKVSNVSTNLTYTTATTTGSVNSSDGTNATIPAATTALAGLMIATDKVKLDGIATGAQVNVATNLSATAGTTAGPTIVSSTGTNVVIPSASATKSGVVTTTTQTIAGAKTFSSTITGSITGNAGTATSLSTASGTAGQILTSAGAGAPTWQVNTAILDGSSVVQAAQSPQHIKNVTGTTTSGYYYIECLGIGATQVWCDMSGSTAWMLAMRFTNGEPTFNYASAYWTDGATNLNATGDPLTNIDIKNGAVWNGINVTELRLTASSTVTAYTANPLTFGPFGTTCNTIFTSGNNVYNASFAYTRAQWLAWLLACTGKASTDFDTQPNCNQDAINNLGTGTYARVRLGWAGNNETDCGTNDSNIGIGGYTSAPVFNVGCGGISWTPAGAGRAHGWLWVR